MRRREFLPLLTVASGATPQKEPAPEPPVEWTCPMDKDVRSDKPGTCPRCRMRLVPGIPDLLEYPLLLSTTPKHWKAGRPVSFRFSVQDPKTRKPVRSFEVMHEKLFHLFIISNDLSYFAHEHPEPQPDGTFVYVATLPKPGFYRLLTDFYPQGATPQLAVKTIASHKARLAPARISTDLAPKQTANLGVSLRMEPPQPIAGLKTMLFFSLAPAQQIEQYLGAWGHLLVGSEDLIDLIHTHPFLADGGPEPQFNVVFPRAGLYRLWAQFQRAGVVNTAVFTVEAKGL